MFFWIFVTACTALIPLLMLIFGKYLKSGKPKKINYFIGFRTAESMKSPETWRFANAYCGKLWVLWGIILLPINIGGMCVVLNKSENAIGLCSIILCAADIIVMIFTVISTQKELKRRFGGDKN